LTPPGVPTPAGGSPEDRNPVERAFRLFQELRTAGKEPEIESFCREHPEAGPELRERLEHLLLMDRALGKLFGEASTIERPESPGGELLDAAGYAPGSRIDRYEVLEELGEGGMGRVYLVRQERPVRRIAALKLIKPGTDSRQVLHRFEGERQALALMDHPNVARIYDAGTDRHAHPYFVMEYIAGLPIDEFCRLHRLSIDERLRLFLRVCAGVQHAHQKGILHRDLKPGNILVTEIDGVPQPKIIDFGLARAIHPDEEERSLLTIQGQMLGTPEYMAPEQACRDQSGIDSRADLYALGVILYQCLTGSLPIPSERLRKAGLFDMQRMICDEEIELPSQRLRSMERTKAVPDPGLLSTRRTRIRLQGDLDWILRKALAKDREERYATVASFAQDIEHHLENEPVLAGPPSGLYRLKKLARKHRKFVAGLTFVFLILVGSLVSILSAYEETKAALRLAASRAEEIDHQSSYLKSFLYSITDDYLDRLRGKVESQQLVAGWTEDFESYPPGPFRPDAKSRWLLTTENQDIHVVEDEDPERGRVLRLRGKLWKIDGAAVAIPLSKSNLALRPEFTLSFWVKVRPDNPEVRPTERNPSDAGGVNLASGPYWRTSKGRRRLGAFSTLGGYRLLIYRGNKEKKLDLPLPKGWNPVFLHYRRLDLSGKDGALQGKTKSGKPQVRITCWIGDRIARVEDSFFPLEATYKWLTFSSNQQSFWIDDLRVSYPTTAQPWRHNPGTGHTYERTPRPMEWGEARAWARARGGHLLTLEDPTELSWVEETFSFSDYWIGLVREKGAWSWEGDGPRQTPIPSWFAKLHAESSYPGIGAYISQKSLIEQSWQWQEGGGIREGIVEYEHDPPISASSLWWGQGCMDSDRRFPYLEVRSPPVLGKTLELELEGGPRTERATLIVGGGLARSSSSLRQGLGLDLLPGTPGTCLLYPEPSILLPPLASSRLPGDPPRRVFRWKLPIPGNRELLGRLFFAQAFLADPGSKPLGFAASQGIRAQCGFDPPGGSLLEARSLGGELSRRGPGKVSLALRPPVGKRPREILLAGGFEGILDYGDQFPRPVDRVRILRNEAREGTDAFLASFDLRGRGLWARAFRGPGDQTLSAVRANDRGEIYVAGTYTRPWSVRLADGRTRRLPCLGPKDVFLAKLEGEGELRWIRRLGRTEGGSDPALALGPGGEIYLAGSFRGRLEPDPGTETRRSGGGEDWFLVRYDEGGRFQWVLSGGGEGEDRARAVVVSGTDGSVYFCGSFEKDCVFPDAKKSPPLRFEATLPADPFLGKAPQNERPQLEGFEDAFLARYSPSGERLWVRTGGGAGPDAALCLDVSEDGRVAIGGYNKTLAWFPGSGSRGVLLSKVGWTDAFVLCYSPEGEPLWGTKFQGSYGKDSIRALDFAADGALAVTGSFVTALLRQTRVLPIEYSRRHQAEKQEFSSRHRNYINRIYGPSIHDPEAPVTTMDPDILVARIRTDGTPDWTRAAGGRGEDIGTAVLSLPDGTILSAGRASRFCTFGFSEPSETTLLRGGIFLARYLTDLDTIETR